MKQPSDFLVSDWLTYLEDRHPEKIQLGLLRVQQIINTLHLQASNAIVITVAGTNGKGSTIAALEAIYSAAGYQVAAYTSPHLLCFNERIRVNQEPITDEHLIDAFRAVHAIPGSELLTYFEMVTVAALWHFKQTKPDVILLEVGMGGRLDATNCIDANLAIITTIDFDHEAWLGTTREKIAIEKAGIFRQHQPAIYADIAPPHTLLDKADALQVTLSKLDKDYFFESDQNHLYFSTSNQIHLTLPRPHIHLKAFASALMASLRLKNVLPVSLSHYESAAKYASISGRQQWLNTTTPTLVDVAHNAQSVKLLADFIKNHPIQGQIHAVFSGLQNKTLYDLIEPMRAYVDKWYITSLESTRGATLSSLKTAYMRVMNKQPLAVFNEPLTAYTAAVNAVKPGDIIIVYGSFLLVSAVMLAHLRKGEQNELRN
ncbi:MAG: bifunctional folylpolyglutamate synthase/dihydrofolate synthase [Gammaproteobacteria bacterium]|nr:bifunctional folylpolyglutamate synthase/dihydrofolate synthase [Gammaproteobacteria bacterium]